MAPGTIPSDNSLWTIAALVRNGVATSGYLMPMTDPWDLIDFTYIYQLKNPPFMLGKHNVLVPWDPSLGCVSHESRRCVTLGMTRVEEWSRWSSHDNMEPLVFSFGGVVYVCLNRLMKYDFITYRLLGWCIGFVYIFYIYTYYIYIYNLYRYTIRYMQIKSCHERDVFSFPGWLADWCFCTHLK